MAPITRGMPNASNLVCMMMVSIVNSQSRDLEYAVPLPTTVKSSFF